jgi:hypothetical protein
MSGSALKAPSPFKLDGVELPKGGVKKRRREEKRRKDSLNHSITSNKCRMHACMHAFCLRRPALDTSIILRG